MNDQLLQAANSLMNRENVRLVGATGLFFQAVGLRVPNQPIRTIIESHRGGVWGEDAATGYGFPVLRSTNMRGVRAEVTDVAWRAIAQHEAEKCVLCTGDILVTKSSGSSDLVGKSTLFIHPEDGRKYLFSNFILRLRPNTGVVLPEYLAWFLRSPQALAWRFDSQQNAVGLRNLKTEAFLDQPIPVPNPSVQHSIVDYLNAVEIGNSSASQVKIPEWLSEQRRIVAKIEQLAAKIEEARELRQRTDEARNIFIAAVTTEIFQEHDGSQRVRIGELGENDENPIQIGPFGAQLHKSEFTETGIPVLNVGNVWPEGLRFDRLDHVTSEKASQLKRYSLKADDLLFARSGATLGKVCIVPKECDGWLMTGHLFRVRFDQQRCNPWFAFAALRGARSVRDQVFDQVRGATRPGFNTTLLSNVELPVPPLSEQRRIVAYLDGLQAQVDRLKALQAQTAAELDALLPSILDKAFKGQL